MPERSPRLVGVVDRDGQDRTRRVVISYSARHPRYGKYIRKRTVLHVHDETNESHMGDRVEIAECRPVSRMKRWALVRIVEKAPVKAEIVYGEAVADRGTDGKSTGKSDRKSVGTTAGSKARGKGSSN
ncbi:MAG: 30S ribosomal protein S17 [Planctomycetes bacterium]|nr:30S ribosomal protein S17 [Planctomycetota bacterium]